MTFHSSPAAAWESANNLYSHCKAVVSEMNSAGSMSDYAIICVSYFEGVGDALLRVDWGAPNQCVTSHYLNLDDLNNMAAFVAYMDKHPERRDDIAADVIRSSVEENCKK
jgi:hypothetical protein